MQDYGHSRGGRLCRHVGRFDSLTGLALSLPRIQEYPRLATTLSSAIPSSCEQNV
jgi:hypothetical protein